MSGRRQEPLLPRDVGGELWLGVVIGVLCFLACLAGAGALAADRAAHGWAGALRGEATVQVRPRVNESGDAAAARAAEVLAGVDGVEEAQAMDRETAEALLRPWVGEGALPDLPIPHLVTVRLRSESPASTQALSSALAGAGLDASVDDHGLWREEVQGAAGTVTLIALAAFVLIAAAAAAAVAYATRAGMAALKGLIETLSLSGATDSRIAWLFQARFARVAGLAGLAGAAGAAAVLAMARLVGGPGGLTPALPVTWTDIMWLSPCPIVAATVAFIAARASALRALTPGGDKTVR